MSYIYHLVFYNPLLNTLVFLYQTIGAKDLGIAIILLTVVIRIILFPVFQKSAKYQRIMQELQPKLKKIREENKKDFEKRAQLEMALYKEHRVNPFSGFLTLLIQLPILIALYQIIFNILKPDALQGLYFFVEKPSELHTVFLNLINLEKPNTILVGLTALLQYFQMKSVMPPKNKTRDPSVQERVSQQMTYLVPIILFFVFFNLPAAITLYWFVMSVFSLAQQYYANHQHHGTMGHISSESH